MNQFTTIRGSQAPILHPGRRWLGRPGLAAAATATGRCTHCARPLPIPSRRTIARAAEVTQAISTQEQQQGQDQPPSEFSVDLPTADVQAAVQVMGVRQGRGAAIVVCAVEPGSEAAKAGVRVGQQLLGVSDPIRRTEMWELNAQASLRYTRQAIRMRVAESITLRLTSQPIPEWQEVVAARRAAAADAVAQQQGMQQAEEQQAGDGATTGNGDSTQGEEAGDLLSAIVQAAEAERSASSMDEADPSSSSSSASAGFSLPSSAAAPSSSSSSSLPGASSNGSNNSSSQQRELTVAEKLEQQYAERQQAEAQEAPGVQRQLTDLERRQRRRKEYFEQASQRNDGPFFAAVAAMFIIPPAIILGIAFSSGYIDSLDAYSLLR